MAKPSRSSHNILPFVKLSRRYAAARAAAGLRHSRGPPDAEDMNWLLLKNSLLVAGLSTILSLSLGFMGAVWVTGLSDASG